MRLFIAMPLPAEVREAIARTIHPLIDTMRQTGAPVRWVSPDQFHITLQFLGETKDALLPRLRSTLTGVARRHREFTLELNGLGCFAQRGLTVWLGVSKGKESLMALAEDLGTALEPLGFARERHPFHPHVTLGRSKSSRIAKNISPLLKTTQVPTKSITVQSIDLIQSVLSSKGPTYTTLFEARLLSE